MGLSVNGILVVFFVVVASLHIRFIQIFRIHVPRGVCVENDRWLIARRPKIDAHSQDVL